MMKHFSHRHELEMCTTMPQGARHEYDDEEEALLCSICGYELEDLLHHSDDANVHPLIYQCYKSSNSKCRFYAHDLCLQLPREILHNSHPKHPLLLLNNNNNNDDNSEFVCNACGGSSGSCFVYHCPKCKFNLHVQCATLPQTLSHREHHQHALTLLFSVPNLHGNEQQKMSRICDLCKGSIFEGCWLYYCKECDYGTHVDCVTTEAHDHHHANPLEQHVIDMSD